MSNYPPGMTIEDWKHIDGEQHYGDCPLHEDYEHDCWSEAKTKRPAWAYSIIPEACLGSGCDWSIDYGIPGRSYRLLPIIFCPYCGEELPLTIECCCEEIAQALKEDIMEQRAILKRER